MGKYGIRRVRSGLKSAWRVFLPGMEHPTYHKHHEEAVWALKLRGHHGS